MISSAHPKAIVLREKDLSEKEYEQLARQVMQICQKHGTQCILHSFSNVAIALGAVAVHMPLPLLQKMTPQEKSHFQIIGASCHSLEEAKEAHAKATNAVKKQEDAIAKNTVKLNESKAALTEQNTALKNTEEELTNAEKKWTVFGQEIKTAGSNMDEAGNKTISLGDVIKANLISSAIISGVKGLPTG